MRQDKPSLAIFYWHTPSRRGSLELVTELRDAFRVLIISNEKVDYLSRHADEVLVGDYGDPSALARAVARYKAEKGLDGWLTMCEAGVTLGAQIMGDLGLRTNPLESARMARNKFLMRELFDRAGIPSPRCFRAGSLAEAEAILAEHFDVPERPAFLKAPYLGGSAFTSKIQSVQALRELWPGYFADSWSITRRFPGYQEMFGADGRGYYLLLEECLGGTRFDYDDLLGPRFPVCELSVEGFIEGEHTTVYSITDKLLPPEGVLHGEEHMFRMHSRVPPQLKTVLAERVNTLNFALGARMGCSHTEFRIEDAPPEAADIEYGGRHYRARVIETALRKGGVSLQQLFYITTGFNSIRAMAYQACGIPHREAVTRRIPAIKTSLWPVKGGRLVRIDGLDRICALNERLLRFNLYDAIGDMVKVPPYTMRPFAEAIVWGHEDLLKMPGWETRRGAESPYRATEEAFLQVREYFQPVVAAE